MTALRRVWPVALLLLALTRAAEPASKFKPDPEPEIVRTAAGVTEVGTLYAVPYRIDIPASWMDNPQRALVVYFHGYSEGPFTYRATAPLNEQTQPLFDRGYGINPVRLFNPRLGACRSLSGVRAAAPVLYQTLRAARRRQGRTRARDHRRRRGSMGGALVVATLELNPKPYAGGLDLCGSVGPTDLAFQRRFAWRAAFDFFFPSVMPQLVLSPVEFQETRGLRQRAIQAMRANDQAATAMRNLMSLHTDAEVADDIVYFTYVIADLQHRAGGNPFDNRNFLYTGTNPTSSATDNALNDGVHRYAADPRARDYLIHHYTPTGRLTHPMLALHTTYDPRIPGNTLTVYAEQVALAGQSQNLVQQYVHRDGHCTFTQDEVGRSFDELISWIHTGKAPSAGLLPPAVGRPVSPASAR